MTIVAPNPGVDQEGYSTCHTPRHRIITQNNLQTSDLEAFAVFDRQGSENAQLRYLCIPLFINYKGEMHADKSSSFNVKFLFLVIAIN